MGKRRRRKRSFGPDPGPRPAPGELTVAELVARWRTEQAARSRGHRLLMRQVARVLEARMGARQVKDVQPRELFDLVPSIVCPTAGVARRNRIRAALHRLFEIAVELGELDRNPIRWRPERERGRPRPAYRPEELDALLEAARPNPRLYALILLGATTGARLGELVALRGRDLDRGTGELTLFSTKTGAHRILSLPAEVVKALPNVAADERFFPHEMRDAFGAALRRAGLAGRGLTFHSLRHTWTTLAARAGIPTAVLREVLGHGSLNTTERYAKRIGAPIPVGEAVFNALAELRKRPAPPAS
ncbi:MAG: site-specific integrase [Planctomycetes bacterium]|nr:site-specific integrase [Planctomycetota bacterium]